MPYYTVQGSCTVTGGSAFGVQGALIYGGTPPRRAKIYEIIVGATANPNATDTYIQYDLSRTTTTPAAGTSVVPAQVDNADAAAVLVAFTTTSGATVTAATSLFNAGVNQRNTVRWVASQESQYLVTPATSANGLAIRAASSTYVSTVATTLSWNE